MRSKQLSRKKKRNVVKSDLGSEDNSSSDESPSSEEEDIDVKRRLGGKKKDKSIKELKSDEKLVAKPNSNVQLNIEDLAEHFKHLELKLGERSTREHQLQKLKSTLYCIMCGQLGHLVCKCADLRFYITQGICRMT